MVDKKKVSIKDIARAAGVSPTLVSFVLNGQQKKYRVNADVAQKILDTAKEMNYRPNPLAKGLRNGKSKTIGVILSDISNPFFATMARHIEETAEARDYIAQFTSSDESAERERELLGNLLYRGVDGIMLVPCDGAVDLIKEIQSRNVPLVLLDRNFDDIATNYVCLDNKMAGVESTNYLIGKGYKKIGMTIYNQNLQHMKDRECGYIEAMRASGLSDKCIVKSVNHSNMEDSCKKAVEDMLSEGMEALLFATNNISVQCIKILLDMGKNIPEDIDVLGFDGGDAFDFFRPELSYYKQPIDIMSCTATNMLINHIENPGLPTEGLKMSGMLIKR